jgi:hypothetical protein
MNAGDAPGRVSYRPLEHPAGTDMLAINRACPIRSAFTFRFDREPDFFAWPSQLFDSFDYTGIYAGEALRGYVMAGFRDGWTGERFARCAYAGDLRLVSEFRGHGLALGAVQAAFARLPHDVEAGYFIVHRGNRAARKLAERGPLTGCRLRRAGTFEMVNIPVALAGIRRRGEGGTCRLSPADLPAVTRLLQRDIAGRLFAPRLDEESVWDALGGPTFERTHASRSGGRLVGFVAWRDFWDIRRATVIRYPVRSWPIRAAWAAAALVHPGRPPLPPVGGALRSLVVTHIGTDGQDPSALRALLRGVIDSEAGRGAHLVQIGAMHGNRPLEAARGFVRSRFCSDVWVGCRPDRDAIMDMALDRQPFVDPAIV